MKAAHQLVVKAWGDELKRIRVEELELTQIHAAERVGIDQGRLSRIERGEYAAMTPQMCLRFCIGYGIENPNSVFRYPPAIVEIAQMRQASAEAAA